MCSSVDVLVISCNINWITCLKQIDKVFIFVCLKPINILMDNYGFISHHIKINVEI